MSLSIIAAAALAKARSQNEPRRFWTQDEEHLLTQLYPSTPMPELMQRFNRLDRAIYSKAKAMGLSRSAEYLASEHACRLRKGDNVGAEHRFKSGQAPWNKGAKGWQAGGRSAETRFARGQVNGRAAQLLQPIGAERVTDDGIRQRKVRDDGPPQHRWKSVHALLWEEVNGPIPAGHLVVFKDRNKQNIQIDNLELISRAENCRRNSIHRYPPELKHAIRTLAKLKRTIEDSTNEEPA